MGKLNDVIDEKVIIGGKEYTLTHEPTHDPETGILSFPAKCGNREVVIDYKLLNPDDLDCYDIENPIAVTDVETGKDLLEE